MRPTHPGMSPYPDDMETSIEEQNGWLVVPATGHPVTDDDVREVRDADQR